MVSIQRNILTILLTLAVFSATISTLFGFPNIHIPIALIFVFIGFWNYGVTKFQLLILQILFVNILINAAEFSVQNLFFMMGYLTIILYSSLMKEYDFQIFQSVLVKLSILIILGQLINLYLDRSIFGLIGGSIYSDESIGFDEKFTQRGISFITSPQSLTLFYLVVAFVSLRTNNKIGLIIAVLGAILTGSKFSIFVIVLILFGVIIQFKDKRLKWGILLFSISGLLIFSNSEFLSRIFSIVSLIGYDAILGYSAYEIWSDSFMQIKFDFFHLFVGSFPFGFSSRIFQNLYGGLYYGSTESTAISWLLDGGILFFVLLGYRIFKIAKKQVLITKIFVLFCIANILFTPALYSSLTPLFVFPYLLNKRLH